jgi:hypothetical protein
MLEAAVAAGKVKDSLVNITTSPGGRKVLQDAEVALSSKVARQEAMVVHKLALELFRDQVLPVPNRPNLYF